VRGDSSEANIADAGAAMQVKRLDLWAACSDAHESSVGDV
jgi:hypothetical protein